MKAKFLFVFLTYTFLAGTYAEAQGGVLPLNNTVNGMLSSSTPDIWDITTTSDGLLKLSLNAISPADLYLTLYDNNGTAVLGGPVESFNNSTAIINADGLAPGTYHIKITPFGMSIGSYTLTDSFFTASLTNDVEPNRSTATAVTLPINSGKTGHVGYYYNSLRDTADWYKVTTTGDGLLRVYLTTERSTTNSTNITNPLDVNVDLYDNNGTTQLGHVEVFNGYGPATNFVSADGLAPGTYYIKVQPFSTAEFADYTISDSLFTPPLANDAESNGTSAAAVTLPINSGKTGHVGYYYNNLRDTADWYKVTTTADGLLRVYLTTARGSVYSSNLLDVNITLYDNNGTTQLGFVEVFNGYGPATNFVSADGLAPGTYYIKVEPFSTDQFADYTITDSLFTPALGNDAEPNGTVTTAGVLPLNSNSSGHVGYYYNNLRDTADWYKVTTTADGLLRVYLTTARGSVYSNNTLDVNMTLYDNNGTTQLANVEVFNGNGPATNFMSADGLAPGIYYIRIQPYSTAQFADYTITDSLFTPSLANDAEPNGTSATAVVLPVNSSKTGQVGFYYNNLRDTADWYKVTTTADGLLRVYLTTARASVYSNNTLDVNMTLYDNNATTQLANVEVFNGNGPATNFMTADGLAPGTYYIKVQPYSTAQFADYTITDSLFTPVLANDAEPNGTAATATVLPVNSSKTGHVGYYYNNQRDTADWYKVTTTADGPMHINLAMERGGIYSNNTLDVIVTVYDNTGTTQMGSREVFNGNGPGTDSINLTTVPAGTYYIKVQPFSTAEFADYTLTEGRVPLTIPVIISTSPAGLNKLIDGLDYGSQDVFHWVPGSSHTVSTTSPQTASGTAYVWYNWTDGGAISHSIIAPSVETTYTANFETQLVATPTIANASCYGSTGSVSFATSGGTGPFIFYLKNASTGNVVNNSTGIFTNIPAGVYLDSIVDANLQYVTGTVTISQPAQVILPAIVFTGGTTVCSGSSLSLTDAVAGGVWSSSNLSLATVSSSGVVNFGSPATATQVTISYTVSGSSSCSSVVSVTFTVNTSLSSGTIKGNTSVCVGNTIQLTNNVTGGIWSSSNNNVHVDPANGIITGITAGSTTISYTVGSGTCTAISTFLVTVQAMPNASEIHGSNFIKKGFSTRFTDQAAGGIWSSSNTQIASVSPDGVVRGIGIGNCIIYYVVSNSSGCSDTAKKAVTVYANFIAKPVSGNIICNGGTTTITVNVSGGSGSYRYRLNGGKSQLSNVFTVTAGTYLILVEDIPFKRLTICLVVVRQPLPLVVVPVKETNATSGSSNGSFSVRGLGGNPPYHFSIDGGSNYQDSGTFSNLSAGNYSVTIKDANGCIALNETTVNVLNTESKEHAIVGVDVADAGNIKKGFDYSIQSNVYPNPSQSYFTLDLKSNSRQKVEIQVFDLLGQTIYEMKGEAPNSYRFGQNFGKGVYFIRLIYLGEVKTIRIIKE
jgi:Secretion system C-terminal sorting domain/SprB repeat